MFVCLFPPRSHEVWTNLTSPLKSFKYLCCRGFQLVGMNTLYGNFPKNPWASNLPSSFRGVDGKIASPIHSCYNHAPMGDFGNTLDSLDHPGNMESARHFFLYPSRLNDPGLPGWPDWPGWPLGFRLTGRIPLALQHSIPFAHQKAGTGLTIAESA